MDVPILRRGTALCALAILAVTITIPASGADTLPGVTVEAQREHEKLKHEVVEFVSSAIVQSHYDMSLQRWTQNRAACPLVAGLNRDQGEYVLARISQIAKDAGAPLGSEKCKPDLFILVINDPETVLRNWAVQYPKVFSGKSGHEVKKLIEIPRQIRVWYNVGMTSVDGASLVLAAYGNSTAYSRGGNTASGGNISESAENVQPSSLGSRLTHPVTLDFLSAVIIVDASQLNGISMGQIADYVGLVGLAQINLGQDFGNAPTILSLFRSSDDVRPQQLTNWDKALLHALYTTPQRDRMQISEMETVALNDITSKSAPH